MGKGDKKSRRGKIILGTYGVRRPRIKKHTSFLKSKITPVSAGTTKVKTDIHPKAKPVAEVETKTEVIEVVNGNVQTVQNIEPQTVKKATPKTTKKTALKKEIKETEKSPKQKASKKATVKNEEKEMVKDKAKTEVKKATKKAPAKTKKTEK